VLPEGRHVHRPGDIVLLPEGDDTLWHQLLQQRRGLPGQVRRAVWVPGRHDTVWQRRLPDLLPGGAGVWRRLPLGLVAGDSGRLRQRHDQFEQHEHEQQQHEQQQHEHEQQHDDNDDLHGARPAVHGPDLLQRQWRD